MKTMQCVPIAVKNKVERLRDIYPFIQEYPNDMKELNNFLDDLSYWYPREVVLELLLP